MKTRNFLFLLSFLGSSCFAAFPEINGPLDRYKEFLEHGTLDHQDWSSFAAIPKSRYYTFKKAFELFEEQKGNVIVELGTTRSYVHGGISGCNSDDTRYWTPDQPENWDWGAGSFTRVAAECLEHLNPIFYTVDLDEKHINRCKLITAPFSYFIKYHVTSSLTFLNTFSGKIDLLYMDTGDMTPIEPTAQLSLEEAKIVVRRNLIAPGGLILIDDVRNQTPKQYGDTSGLGKAKYSLPYLLENGFEIVEDEYQILLCKK